MHEHCEIVLPLDVDMAASVAEIMGPFDENGEDQPHAFWDFYVIGGRWAGQKLKASLDPKKLEAFYALLAKHKITVSGLQPCKPTPAY